ncbi:MAG: phytanoyl-CoA dioxygenase family protein [Comamonadaceae bacterium]|nr:phytanoyl-CoA dioxygenase family protein [Comamonadaceae bacterium]
MSAFGPTAGRPGPAGRMLACRPGRAADTAAGSGLAAKNAQGSKLIQPTMVSSVTPDGSAFDPAVIMGGLYGDGIIALQGAFPREWAQRLREDIDRLFAEARARPHGALPRGPERYYVEVHPERLRGFVDIASHPWFVAVCEAVLGPHYQVVEVGFDVPGPGARDQPWHRDFPMPDATRIGRRIDSLAFNLTAVDTVADMGPLQIAPGTHWDQFGAPDDPDREQAMFPPPELHPLRSTRAVPPAAVGRHLGPLGAHHPPGHRQSLQPVAAGARRRRRCARWRQRRPPRPAGHPRLPRRSAGGSARASELPGGRSAGRDRAGAFHRGAARRSGLKASAWRSRAAAAAGAARAGGVVPRPDARDARATREQTGCRRPAAPSRGAHVAVATVAAPRFPRGHARSGASGNPCTSGSGHAATQTSSRTARAGRRIQRRRRRDDHRGRRKDRLAGRQRRRQPRGQRLHDHRGRLHPVRHRTRNDFAGDRREVGRARQHGALRRGRHQRRRAHRLRRPRHLPVPRRRRAGPRRLHRPGQRVLVPDLRRRQHQLPRPVSAHRRRAGRGQLPAGPGQRQPLAGRSHHGPQHDEHRADRPRRHGGRVRRLPGHDHRGARSPRPPRCSPPACSA